MAPADQLRAAKALIDAPDIATGLLNALVAVRNECSGKPRPHMLVPLLAKADEVIARARKELAA